MASYMKTFLTAFSFGILSLPISAVAQIYDGPGFSQNERLNLQTSVNFKIPLGATDKRRLSDQPRLSLGLSLVSDDFGLPFARPNNQYRNNRFNLLDVGTYGFKEPSLQLVSQEIYGPTFVALHANETEGDTDEAGKGSNTALLVVGGLAVAAAGSFLFLKEIEDEVADCLDAINRPGECAD